MAIPPLRVALADPEGNIGQNLDTISLADLAALLEVGGVSNRFLEMRVILSGVNDGDSIGNPIEGLARGQNGNAQAGRMWTFLGGAVVPVLQKIDGRRCLKLQNGANNVSWVFRPTAGGALWACDVGGTFPSTTGTYGSGIAEPQFGWCTNIQFQARKILAADGSDCRVCIGFADNNVVSPSAEIARVGLIGDGLGGYLYGSVNCPDGALAGVNAPTDRDADFFQPADLVTPADKWWTTRLKLIPATPTQSALLGAYHNGTLVHTFTNPNASLPRGHQTTNDQFAAVELSMLNLSADPGVVGFIPGLLLYQIEVWFDDVYSFD